MGSLKASRPLLFAVAPRGEAVGSQVYMACR